MFFGGKRIARQDASGNMYYYAEDMLGSSRTIVSVASGQTTGTLCYDADFYPYGGENPATNTCSAIYKFEGKERDTETNNDDFGARYYSSAYGWWLSADWSSIPVPVPYANLTNPQTLNLYATVRDNPETFADLDGHQDCPSHTWANSTCDTQTPPQPTTPQNTSCLTGNGQGPCQDPAQTNSAVQNLVDAQNAAMANGQYAPNTPTAGTTHCSEAACSIAQQTGMLSDATCRRAQKFAQRELLLDNFALCESNGDEV